MTDPIVDNATAPAPPDASEARRQQIMGEADYWNDGPNTRALRDEMKRITAAPAAAVADDNEAAARLTPAEQRVKKANENPALWDAKHKDHQAARKELREAVAAATTPEEIQVMADAPATEHRERYGLGREFDQVLPSLRGRWSEDAEATILTAMTIRGVAPETVKSLYSWWAGEFNRSLGQVVDPAGVEKAFRERAAKLGLPKDLTDNIVKAEKERLEFA